MERILRAIIERNHFELQTYTRLFGGDINEVYRLSGPEKDWVVKINDAATYPGMFEAELRGLELLESTKTFRVPKVIGNGEIENKSYLLIKFIEQGNPGPTFWESFGISLARLHQNTSETFGLDHSNYIGSLPQPNGNHSSAKDFYIHERLRPQFEMAERRGFRFEALERFLLNIENEIPVEGPSLIHGDLWNGNYLVDHNGAPVLIDPAVSFAPREMDFAMMHLFGGFPPVVFESYESIFPMLQGWKNRLDIWQLYYLLVHLNLFGSGYLSQVRAIVNRYS